MSVLRRAAGSPAVQARRREFGSVEGEIVIGRSIAVKSFRRDRADTDANLIVGIQVAVFPDGKIGSRDALPRRTATISARIETAISSGVIAPRSRPAGAFNLASRSGATWLPSFAFSASAFFRLPTKAT